MYTLSVTKLYRTYECIYSEEIIFAVNINLYFCLFYSSSAYVLYIDGKANSVCNEWLIQILDILVIIHEHLASVTVHL